MPLKEKETQPVEKYPHFGSWHRPHKIGYLTFAGMITGCGVGQVYGVSSYNPKEFKKPLEELIKYCQEVGCGMILCTLGNTYYSKEPMLLEAGFKLLTEYRNLKHIDMGSPQDTQKLYGYEVPVIEKVKKENLRK